MRKYFSSILWLDLEFSANLASKIQLLSLSEYFISNQPVNLYNLLLSINLQHYRHIVCIWNTVGIVEIYT